MTASYHRKHLKFYVHDEKQESETKTNHVQFYAYHATISNHTLVNNIRFLFRCPISDQFRAGLVKGLLDRKNCRVTNVNCMPGIIDTSAAPQLTTTQSRQPQTPCKLLTD